MGADGGGALGVARSLAGYGLRAQEPLGVADPEWDALFALLARQRLTGVAMAAAETGTLPLSGERAATLADRHRDAMMHALVLERMLLTLVEAFERAGIDVAVLKGPALAHTVYPDPSWRPFGDLDLLVRTADWRGACALLSRRNLHRLLPEPRRGFDERFGKAAAHATPGGWQVDLHRMLVVGPFGLWIDSDELFDRTDEFRLGGRPVRRLDDTGILLHACVHASLGSRPPLLLPLRDVAQAALASGVDWDALLDRAARWRLGAVVRHAFATVERMIGVSIPAGASTLAALHPTRAEQRALQAFVTDRRERGGQVLATVAALPGLRRKAAYVTALVFPDRRFLRARAGDGSHASYRSRWAVPIRWVTRRSRL